jgi:hypothetical protein
MYSEEQKQQIYKKFIANGRPWFALDKSLEPTWEERKVILEMKERENQKIKRELELEKRTKQFKVYEKKGKIQDSVFDTVSKELGDY